MLSSSPYTMSAELNAMKWVLEDGCRDVRRIVLYASDTIPGMKCAELLKSYLETRCRAEIAVRVVKGLAREMWLGISNLGKHIVDDVVEARRAGLDVYINLTGGFKPESGIALLAAAVSGANAVYYIHESFRDVVWLPIPPLRVDRARLESVLKLLEHIARSDRIDPRDPLVAQHRWVVNILLHTGFLKLEKVDDREMYVVTHDLRANLEYIASYIRRLLMIE